MKINAKFYKAIIKILTAVIVLVVLAVAVFLVMQIAGKSRLYGSSDSARPDLSNSSLAEVVEQESTEEGLTEGNQEEFYEWQEGDVRYEGTIYRYNEDILTFLFMGVDKESEVKAVKDGITGGQADSLFLLVLNPETKTASVIGIPRDTMTEVDVYDEKGSYQGSDTRQICLQHGYGDGMELSCERTVTTVSELFYNLPIHGYCAVNVGAIKLLNDAVGGVEVTALEDVANSDIKAGDVLHLMGDEACEYIRNRDITVHYTAEGRLERQKQYLLAYAEKVREMMKTDITLPLTLYNTLHKYMVTDITADEISYLATQVADYHFSGEDITSLTGEVSIEHRFEEFYPDERALYELILDTFYDEVNGNGMKP